MAKSVDKLAEELFRSVQAAQGFAFISDGMGTGTTEDFFRNVRSSLYWTRESARLIAKFLKRHGELPEIELRREGSKRG